MAEGSQGDHKWVRTCGGDFSGDWHKMASKLEMPAHHRVRLVRRLGFENDPGRDKMVEEGAGMEIWIGVVLGTVGCDAVKDLHSETSSTPHHPSSRKNVTWNGANFPDNNVGNGNSCQKTTVLTSVAGRRSPDDQERALRTSALYLLFASKLGEFVALLFSSIYSSFCFISPSPFAIHTLIQIPFPSGVLFVKVKPKTGHHDFTKHKSISQDSVVWEETFSLHAEMTVNKKGVLEPWIIRLSVRKACALIYVFNLPNSLLFPSGPLQDKSKGFERWGVVQVDLAEYRQGLTNRSYLVAKTNCNAILRIAVNMEQIAGEPVYKCRTPPPIRTALDEDLLAIQGSIHGEPSAVRDFVNMCDHVTDGSPPTGCGSPGDEALERMLLGRPQQPLQLPPEILDTACAVSTPLPVRLPPGVPTFVDTPPEGTATPRARPLPAAASPPPWLAPPAVAVVPAPIGAPSRGLSSGGGGGGGGQHSPSNSTSAAGASWQGPRTAPSTPLSYSASLAAGGPPGSNPASPFSMASAGYRMETHRSRSRSEDWTNLVRSTRRV
ncbi:hypothetical protein PAPYR_7496 [Paratrimastix pyriformis]|uniref:C2 NT-type domain-containing protein n=1 Tax=Paratrimastix pyriformis TaxID=342808 RepID=A0ABQ8UFA9_9EUKA|nr:hypothetical protein PAPYR_7496 [Paratrimastix pyriformis]